MTSQIMMTMMLAMMMMSSTVYGQQALRYAEPVPAAMADFMQPPPVFQDVNPPYETPQQLQQVAADANPYQVPQQQQPQQQISNLPAPYYDPAPVYETRKSEQVYPTETDQAEVYPLEDNQLYRDSEGNQVASNQQQQQYYAEDPTLQRNPVSDTYQQQAPQQPQQQPQLQQQTIYDEAVEYWMTNNCQYPPKDFYSMFKYSCDVHLDNIEFTPGLCYAFFNSTKKLCGLDLDEEEQRTLTSVSSLQQTVENDEICDTIYSMKQDDPNLFPKPLEEDLWFQRAYDILFSDKCKYACGLRGAHPICFGYFLSYEVMSERGKVATTPQQIPQQQQISQPNFETIATPDEVPPVSSDLGLSGIPPPPLASTEEQQTQVEESNTQDEEDSKQTKLNTTSKIFRPNPKLLLGQKASLPQDYFYNYDDILLDENLDPEDLAAYIPEQDMLEELDQVIDVFSGKEVSSTDEEKKEMDYLENNREKLLERLNRIDGKLPQEPANPNLLSLDSPLYEEFLYDDPEKLSEDDKKWMEMNDLDDLEDNWISFGPVMNITSGTLMMNFLFLAIGILVLIALFVLFRASRRGYIRRIRLGRHGRNWNYERVQNQPEQEDIYDN